MLILHCENSTFGVITSWSGQKCSGSGLVGSGHRKRTRRHLRRTFQFRKMCMGDTEPLWEGVTPTSSMACRRVPGPQAPRNWEFRALRERMATGRTSSEQTISYSLYVSFNEFSLLQPLIRNLHLSDVCL